MLLINSACSDPTPRREGHIEDGVYFSPGGLFQVDVPVMRNPFVKQPSEIRDERRPDGGEEVTFAVTDLGEAWRYGVTPLRFDLSVAPEMLTTISDQKLVEWLPAPSEVNVLLEEEIRLADGAGLLRVYLQEGASLLFRTDNAERENAIVGVVVVVSESNEQVLFVVGQFDMPMSQLRFFVEDVKMSRDKALNMFARDHATRLRELTTSFKLR